MNEFLAGFSAFPVVASVDDNRWTVVWVDSDHNDGSYHGIFGQHLDQDLQPSASADFQINTFTEYSQTFPALAMNPGGSFLVAWHDQGHVVRAPKFDVKGRFYGSDGAAVGDEFSIALTADGAPYGVRVASLAELGFVATWSAAPDVSSDPESYDIFFRLYDSTGESGAVQRANTRVSGAQAYPDVAGCADGRFVIVWQSTSRSTERDSGVFGQWFDAAGQELGNEFHVNQHAADLQNLPTIATTRDCQAVVIWQSRAQDGDQEGVYGRIFGAGGVPVTDEFQVNATTQGRQGYRAYRETALVADSNTTFLAVWSSDPLSSDAWDIMGQAFCWLNDGELRVCGNASCVGDSVNEESVASINAADALTTLRAAVGTDVCSECRCDVNASGDITASDALMTLHAAISLPIDLNCPPCAANFDPD